MYKKYALNKLKYDFMGYAFQRPEQLSFHHLIIPRYLSKDYGIGDGYLFWNGAILRQNTSHDYLHTIEHYDPDRFAAITSEMVDENLKGHLDPVNLAAIDDILDSFEREYINERTKHGDLIIKHKYLERVLKK